MFSLWLLDEDFKLVRVINKYKSLQWRTSWYDVGRWELVLSGVIDDFKYVYRADSDYVGVLEWVKVNDGIISYSGRFAESLLDYRISTDRKNYAGKLEEVVRLVVADNAITNKPIKGLKLGVNVSRGGTVNANMFGRNILTYLLELSEVYNISYNIKYVVGQGLIFNMLTGLDRTQSQTVNDWCIFSHEFSNVLTGEYSVNRNYYNFAHVYGEGEDVNRVYVTVDKRKSGEALREIFVDARDLRKEALNTTDYEKLLKERGEQKLAERGEVENISAKIKLTENMVFNLGDVVAYKHMGRAFPLQITAIDERHELGNVEKIVSFGKEKGGVMTAIKNK